MATYLFETADSYTSQAVIWSGYGSQYTTLFADVFNIYLQGFHVSMSGGARYLTRIAVATASGVTTSGSSGYAVNLYEDTDVSPDVSDLHLITAQFMDEFFNPYNTLTIEASYGRDTMYYSAYPEIVGGWLSTSGIGDRAVVDMIFPEYLTYPRFLVAVSGELTDKIVVIPASGLLVTSGGSGRYATNWSAMVSGAIVTDLEAVRIV